MTKFILVSGEKGGVGKTTTAVHLAAVIAANHNRTLLVDLDPRGDAAVLLGQRRSRQCTAWFMDDYQEPELQPGDVITATTRPNLELLASNHTLIGANASLMAGHIRTESVAQRLRLLGQGYDYVIVDANSTSGQLRDAALIAADMLIIPARAEFLGLSDIKSLLLAAGNTRAQARILITMYDGRERTQKEVLAEISANWPDNLIRNGYSEVIVIPRRAAMNTAAMNGCLIFEQEPNGSIAAAYRAVANSIMNEVEATNGAQ